MTAGQGSVVMGEPAADQALMSRSAAIAPGWLRRTAGRIRRAKLRTRVLAGVLLVTLVALASFDITGITALRTYLIGQTDSQLREVLGLYRLVNAMSKVEPGAVPVHANFSVGADRERMQPAPVHSPPVFFNVPLRAPSLQAPFLLPYSVMLVSGRTVQALSPMMTIRGVTITNFGLRPRVAPEDLMPTSQTPIAQGWTVTSTSGGPLRAMAAPYPGGGILIATTSLDGVNTTIGRLELILIIGSATAGLLAMGGAAVVMRRGLRPIETMAGQADAITAGDLTSRVSPADARTEVGRLGVALNGMLARISEFISEREASQEATRRFFADASHELRTPLASLRANAELYEQGALADPVEVDQAMRRITLEAQRMSGLVDDMLRLARLDQHPAQRHDAVDLTAVLRGCAERAYVADPQRSWYTCVAPGLAVIGDEELLRRALDNVLANVRAHTPAGTVATVTAVDDHDAVAIEVSDDGPGVPPSQLARLFDRFYRASAPSPRPGSGLGLAIVAAIAAAHQGTARAALNHPRGLRITLTLPASTHVRPAVMASPGAASRPDGWAQPPR
jgi:two-component system, OmpR family, sensor kinase